MKYLLRIVRIVLLLGLVPFTGCRTAPSHRLEADRNAQAILREEQQKALGRVAPFSIERPADILRRRLILAQALPYSGPAGLGTDRLTPPPHWPEKDYPARVADTSAPPITIPVSTNLTINLLLAMQIGAANSRDYQAQKESIYKAALSLDSERAQFGGIFEGLAEGDYAEDRSADPAVRGVKGSSSVGWSRRLKTGATLGAHIALDLVKLLTGDREHARGLWADTSIAIPLLRGAGWQVITEPVTQAERNVIYALWTFELFKQNYAVQVAAEYLTVLQYLDQTKNAEENYRGLIASARRARRLANAGRLPEEQVNQAMQDELRARERWLLTRATYARTLDHFKVTLGLPPDAQLDLDAAELQQLTNTVNLAGSGHPRSAPVSPDFPSATAPIELPEPTRDHAGPYELEESRAMALALTNRLDLRIALGTVFDAQRQVIVAANGLLPDLTLSATAQFGARRDMGSAEAGNARLLPAHGMYDASLPLNLPWNRTTERAAYRTSFMALETAVRAAQELEDGIKLAVRNDLRVLMQARESVTIQRQAVDLARRRVASTELFLQAGRTEIRDLLEAQEALISAQNSLAASLVNYRVTELQLQRDTGVLEIDAKGLWREYQTNR